MMPNCIARLYFLFIRFRFDVAEPYGWERMRSRERTRFTSRDREPCHWEREKGKGRERALESAGESERKWMSDWAIIAGGERMSDHCENVDNKTTCAFCFGIQKFEKRLYVWRNGSESSKRCFCFFFVSCCWMKTASRTRRIAVHNTIAHSHIGPWVRAACTRRKSVRER